MDNLSNCIKRNIVGVNYYSKQITKFGTLVTGVGIAALYADADVTVEVALSGAATLLSATVMYLSKDRAEKRRHLERMLNRWKEGEGNSDSVNQASNRIRDAFDTDDKALRLTSRMFASLTPSIRLLTNLEDLDVSGGGRLTNRPSETGKLTDLPSEIGELTNLQRLDLSCNNLTKLPSRITDLRKLEILFLDKNPQVQLPPEIAKLTSLERLFIGYNNLTEIPPEIFKLTGLKRLGLEGNKLTEIPPEIVEFTSLEMLGLGENQLTQLPPEIVKLTNLAEINLFKSELTEIPPEIVQLTKLKRLDLAKNQITQVPPEIVQLTKLEWLLLKGNKLTEVPCEIVQLTKLEWLDLAKNQVTQVPREIVQLTKLELLSLRGNKLTKLPIVVANLQKDSGFECSDDNEITKIGSASITGAQQRMQQGQGIDWQNLTPLQLQLFQRYSEGTFDVKERLDLVSPGEQLAYMLWMEGLDGHLARQRPDGDNNITFEEAQHAVVDSLGKRTAPARKKPAKK